MLFNAKQNQQKALLASAMWSTSINQKKKKKIQKRHLRFTFEFTDYPDAKQKQN